jgi:hypothetical protein
MEGLVMMARFLDAASKALSRCETAEELAFTVAAVVESNRRMVALIDELATARMEAAEQQS